VEIMETVDMGETNLNAIIEGDERYQDRRESFGSHGFTEQEFVGEELEDVEPEADDEYDDDEIVFEFEEFLDEEE